MHWGSLVFQWHHENISAVPIRFSVAPKLLKNIQNHILNLEFIVLFIKGSLILEGKYFQFKKMSEIFVPQMLQICPLWTSTAWKKLMFYVYVIIYNLKFCVKCVAPSKMNKNRLSLIQIWNIKYWNTITDFAHLFEVGTKLKTPTGI